LKKRSKKRLVLLDLAELVQQPPGAKFFLLLFVYKKKCFLAQVSTSIPAVAGLTVLSTGAR
jgi:hypothetical protein